MTNMRSVEDQRFRKVMEKAAQGFLIHQGFKPVFVNQAYADLFGYPDPEAILEMDSIIQLFGPEDHSRMLQYRDKRTRGEDVPETYEYQGLRMDGSRVWMENFVSIIDWGGEQAIFNAAMDISARKKTEELLRESERRFRDYAESATDWLWEMDENLRWIYFSGRFGESTGSAPERFLGRTRREFIEQGDMVYGPMTSRADWDRHLADMDAHRPFRNFCHPRMLPDGQIRYVSLSGKPVWDDDGKFKGYRGTGANVTDQVVAELGLRQREVELRLHRDRAEEANLEKSKFLANVSHELRTPLNAIIGFSDIMSNALLGSQDPDRYREYATNIHDSAGQLLKLITDILDITTIQAGEHPFSSESFPFAQIVDECCKSIQGHSDSRNIVLEQDMPVDLPPLDADRNAVRRILMNLLSNAIRYAPDGGKVAVSASVSNNWFDWVVADQGVGIAPAVLPKMTDPFERGQRDPYKSEDGTGLGLTIVQSLVELHGGKLKIESELGKGTRVRVSLPLRSATPSS